MDGTETDVSDTNWGDEKYVTHIVPHYDAAEDPASSKHQFYIAG